MNNIVRRGCVACEKEETANRAVKFKVCNACKSVSYCSPECKNIHWDIHKKYCAVSTNFSSKRKTLAYLTNSAVYRIINKYLYNIIDKNRNLVLCTYYEIESNSQKICCQIFSVNKTDIPTKFNIECPSQIASNLQGCYTTFEIFVPSSENNYTGIVCRVNNNVGDIEGINEEIFGQNDISKKIDDFLNSKECISLIIMDKDKQSDCEIHYINLDINIYNIIKTF